MLAKRVLYIVSFSLTCIYAMLSARRVMYLKIIFSLLNVLEFRANMIEKLFC